MTKTYQAKHFTGAQLDDWMQKVSSGEVAGRGLEFDSQGNLCCSVPGYSKKVYSYTHMDNLQVQPTELDLTTGIFTAPAHGMRDTANVVVTMNDPYYLGAPYDHLPVGLSLGTVSNTATATLYFLRVVDKDHVAISTTHDGEYLTYTAPADLDVSKFHFEDVDKTHELNIKNLNLQECLVVIRGKIMNYFRWIHPNNRLVFGTGFGNHMGGQAYDGSFGADAFGSCNFGRPGYNFTYGTIEFKKMGDRHICQIVNADYVMYSEAGVPTFRHNRQYFHTLLSNENIEGITIYGNMNGAFYNGTTVEVYAK